MEVISKSIDVTSFLEEFKMIAQGEGIYVIPRDKNNKALIDLGINKKIRKEIIMKLTYRHYCHGPRENLDVSDEVFWEFAYPMQGKDIYIKLVISNGNAKCRSFHTAQFPMKRRYG